MWKRLGLGLEGQQGSGLGKAATDPRVLLLWFSKSHWKGWAASVTWVCPDSNSRTQHRHQQLKNHHTIRRLFLCQSAVCVQVFRPPPLLTYWLHRQCVCDFCRFSHSPEKLTELREKTSFVVSDQTSQRRKTQGRLSEGSEPELLCLDLVGSCHPPHPKLLYRVAASCLWVCLRIIYDNKYILAAFIYVMQIVKGKVNTVH